MLVDLKIVDLNMSPKNILMVFIFSIKPIVLVKFRNESCSKYIVFILYYFNYLIILLALLVFKLFNGVQCIIIIKSHKKVSS